MKKIIGYFLITLGVFLLFCLIQILIISSSSIIASISSIASGEASGEVTGSLTGWIVLIAFEIALIAICEFFGLKLILSKKREKEV